jgi:hypothetical protein
MRWRPSSLALLAVTLVAATGTAVAAAMTGPNDQLGRPLEQTSLSQAVAPARVVSSLPVPGATATADTRTPDPESAVRSQPP